MELQALLDTKKEYVEMLCDVFGEAMVGCFERIYKTSLSKPEGRGKSVLAFFQEEVGHVATWNQATIQDEFAIARKKSGCKYIGDLIKAVLVTYVKISLVSNSSVADSSKIKLRVPSAENFYHRCLLLFAREVWKQPYLMYHKVRSIELQQNLNELESIARKCIRAAIRIFVPMDQLVRDVSLNTAPISPPPVVESDSSESDSSSESESESETESEIELADVNDDSTSESEYEQIVEQDTRESYDDEEEVQVKEPEPTEEEEKDEEVQVKESEPTDEFIEKEIEIIDDNSRVSYDAEDPSLKDIDIISTQDEPDDVDKVEEEEIVEKEAEEQPEQKKRIILGSMLINKNRNHKFIKPHIKKPGASDAFF